MNQVQVKVQVGLTFSTALRAFLRQDPDIIMPRLRNPDQLRRGERYRCALRPNRGSIFDADRGSILDAD